MAGGPEERREPVFVGDGDVVDYGCEEGGDAAGSGLERGEVFEGEVGGDEDYELVWEEEEGRHCMVSFGGEVCFLFLFGARGGRKGWLELCCGF